MNILQRIAHTIWNVIFGGIALVAAGNALAGALANDQDRFWAGFLVGVVAVVLMRPG